MAQASTQAPWVTNMPPRRLTQCKQWGALHGQKVSAESSECKRLRSQVPGSKMRRYARLRNDGAEAGAALYQHLSASVKAERIACLRL